MCTQLVKAGQWPTALDTLRRAAAAMPGVQVAHKYLGLQLLRAAVRSGAGAAALQACVDVAPLQQEMLHLLLHHYRIARNLAVRACCGQLLSSTDTCLSWSYINA